MTAIIQAGDRARITSAWLTGCKPGDTGSVQTVIPLGAGGAFYFVKMDPPCRAGTLICYANEIEAMAPA